MVNQGDGAHGGTWFVKEGTRKDRVVVIGGMVNDERGKKKLKTACFVSE
jgi:hypothetical protein